MALAHASQEDESGELSKPIFPFWGPKYVIKEAIFKRGGGLFLILDSGDPRNEAQLLSLLEASAEAQGFDVFISHTWATPGYQKFLSLPLGCC